MSRPVIQLQERLLAARPIANDNRAPISLCHPHHSSEIALDCVLSAIKLEDKAGLLSRVSYTFPKTMKVSSKEAFGYAEALTPLLSYSQVFVVRDLDGDRGYSLRMDTVHDGDFCRERLAVFFDCISEDVAILLKYFDYQASALDVEKFTSNLRFPICQSA